MRGPFHLGLDLGTSKVAAVLLDASHRCVAARSLLHGADLPARLPRSEQDPKRLADAAMKAVLALPEEPRRRVVSVGVTGQMHGLLLVDRSGEPVSPLITWQDARSLESPEFLENLSDKTGHSLRPGFGCATLAWLISRGEMPAGQTSAASIHDWVVSRMCGKPDTLTDPTTAASWGFYDFTREDWDHAALDACAIPQGLLPQVRPCGSQAGVLSAEAAEKLGLPCGIPVALAIGDNQASIFATLRDPGHELALTLGTGGQLSAVLTENTPPPGACPTYECRPYPGGRLAVVAAAMSGGSAWAWLAQTVSSWMSDLDVPTPAPDALYARLNELGLAATTEIPVQTSFGGERFDGDRRGVISGLTPGGLPLGPLARGLARGIFENLRGMMPASCLEGRTGLVGSGNALRRNELLRVMAEAVFNLPLRMPEHQEEAATGTALLAATLAT